MTVRRSLGAGVAWMAFGVRAEALAPAMDVGLAPAAGHDLSTAADAELGPSADAKVDLAEDLEQGEEQSSGSKIWTFLLALGSFPAWGRLPVRSKNMTPICGAHAVFRSHQILPSAVCKPRSSDRTLSWWAGDRHTCALTCGAV
ncbi:unnamed protein product [Prorocentrum cordatum]|uniref:Secreted protein n=1 Tax=Prorocentrum cordatum TaxID=2364126 RepID=A0ABN9WNT1_9DINO|nr:unnamed protein product [Polarella glacialis]